jgi:two-component system, OmpR family, sensor histidine kinase PhoQ
LKLSLTSRLLLAGSIVLTAFLGLTGLILDRAFSAYAEKSLQERIQALTVGLIAAAVVDDNGILHMPKTLPETRYDAVDSGLYAQITSNDGTQRWQSPSMAHQIISLPRNIAPSTRHFQRINYSGGELYTFSLGITFDLSEAIHEGYTFTVAENMAAYNEQIANFRQSLWGSLGSVALLLLAVQGLVLHWSLAPLRQVAEDLAAIESGKQQQLEGHYPREMLGLTDNINALLASQREHLDRHRHTLSDLAHSLKTPLAVLRGELEKSPPPRELSAIIGEQVLRMSEIVDYQLQRAATSGRLPLSAPLAVATATRKIAASLNKVYADKHVNCQINVADNANFHGEEGDLLEVLGNLLDNAYKWCSHRVAVHAVLDENRGLELSVEDDGPGITPQKADTVLQRGVRGDASSPGHGIGLSVVQDIVRVYNGTLSMEKGPTLGGAKITLFLPSP